MALSRKVAASYHTLKKFDKSLSGEASDRQTHAIDEIQKLM